MTTSPRSRLVPHLRRLALQADDVTDADLLSAFIHGHDESAFAGIVQRHGPMVLNVCLRVVGDRHLAEDAFQAAFMVLAKRAACVQPRERLGNWLYGVARRTALKARSGFLRVRGNEKQVETMPQSPRDPDEIWTDVQPILDEELAHLSDNHRTLLVLCDLEGRPQRQVARELKLPPATVANRLAAARKALAKRLSNRGVVLSATTLTIVLREAKAHATLTPGLASELARSACRVSAGEPLASLVPPTVNQLTEGVLKMFVVAKLKKAAVGLVTALFCAAGFATLGTTPVSAEPATKAVPKTTPTPKTETIDDLTFLRRISLDIRGTVPTAIESKYFTTDKDGNKRGKVTEWLLLDHPNVERLHFGIKLEDKRWLEMKNCGACHQGVSAEWLKKNDGFTHQMHNVHDVQGIRFWLGELTEEPTKTDAAKARKPETVPGVKATSDDLKSRIRLDDKAYKTQTDIQFKKEIKKAEIDELKDSLYELEIRLEQPIQEQERQLLLERIDKFEAKIKEVEVSIEGFQVEYTKPVEARLTQIKGFRVHLRYSKDDEFLKRAFRDIAGLTPTKLEERYFLADKDEAKRDKLIDWLLSSSRTSKPQDKVLATWLDNPEMRKKWIAEWKTRLSTMESTVPYTVVADRKPQDGLDKLLADLLAAKKSDAQILESLMLATMGRLPTDTEKTLIVDGMAQVKDRTVAWQGIVKTLTATADAKAHAKTLGERAK